MENLHRSISGQGDKAAAQKLSPINLIKYQVVFGAALA
jgi:hypothetical protein